ncbi:class I SAM-dependent methyltransferase [Acidimicrobiia bacterium EGI L10123]|uniref:class I SAM-dependent methyltransferase n=1 Tax=Salinilacustrithrix flava TaxID=2957203 RepID=UPI003D7C1511|nr:class I SAM-dependent methyltransferase [Acidimicrobiia bacterium EGI L10123]
MTTTDPRPAPAQTEQGTFHHGARSEFNAWFFRTFDRYLNHITRQHKRSAFADIAAGAVVELGAGVGANFAHLPPGSSVLAVEPSEAMHAQLEARAAARGLDLTVIGAYGEDLPIPDASVDEVLCSLVLCTVDDPEAVLAEIRRILRPGGRFRFVEHVAAPSWSPRRWLQHAIRRPWSWVFEGCDLCRDTARTIEGAGFREVAIRRARLKRSAFVPVNTAISGCAVR